MSSTLNTSDLLKALDFQFSAAAAEFFPKPKTDMDRGSRVDTLSYEGDTDDEMPPLTPAPRIERCEALLPSHLMRECDLHTSAPLGYSQRHDGAWSTFSPLCSCEPVAKKLDWGGVAPTPAPEQPWSPAKITQLQDMWTDRLVAIRDEKHEEDIEHLVNYIYDNNVDTLFEELQRKMSRAWSPKDLWVELYTYNHATPNGEDLRDKPYTDKEGIEWPTLRNYLNTKYYEMLVPSRNVDIHWLVKKTSFLKRLAEKFGHDNFTTTYKLTFEEYPDEGVFFYSECSIRLHFWPRGVPKVSA